MTSVVVLLLVTLRDCVRSRAALQLEVLALRHQLHVLGRSRQRRLRLTRADRLLWVWFSRVWSEWRAALVIEAGYGDRLASPRLPPVLDVEERSPEGRSPVPADVRALIRTMSQTNPLWGAPRMHGELLKLGIEVCQARVAKYMVRHRQPPSQTWRTFLANHVAQIAAADFFIVPTATCRLLFVLAILARKRRRVLHVAVTDHPTAAWTTQQLREAFPWNAAPRHLVRDHDTAWATTTAAMDIHEVLTTAAGLREPADIRSSAIELASAAAGHPRDVR